MSRSAIESGFRLGSYEITAALGAGGMGEVWRARDSKLGREVALKVLPEDFAADEERHARFEREAKLLASMNHPNIATLYGLEHLELPAEAVTSRDGAPPSVIPSEERSDGARDLGGGLEAGRSPHPDPSASAARSPRDDMGGVAARSPRDDNGDGPASAAQSARHPEERSDEGSGRGVSDASDQLLAAMGMEISDSQLDAAPAESTRSVHVLVMELVEGIDLSERIAAGAIPVEEAAPIALQIAEALEAAHEQGIVHRDLKPANVKIRPDGTVKVLDFGLAKAWETEGGDQSLSMSPTLTQHNTKAGVILGTASYMAPEQAAGMAADRRADIWSFGVVLWEMLSGRRMFDGETVSHVLASVLKDEPDFEALPDDLPRPVEALLRRCLRKKPKKRLQAIGDARIALEEYLEDPEAVERPATPITAEEAPPLPLWRRALPWAAAVAFGLALAVSLGLRPQPAARVVKATIPPPHDTNFNLRSVRPGPAALSPDGTRMVFSAEDADGVIRLYVRRLDAVEAHVLSDTDGAQYPFWSPDSRWIGFFTQPGDVLRKIDASGGPPITLCPAPNGKGGSWSPDGEIVFAPSPQGPLHRVAAAGGESAPITEVDENTHNSHRLPWFLPDGRHFLFIARGVNQDDSSIMVGSLDGGEPVEAVRAATQAAYASGYLLYVREQTLMAQPFDSIRKRTTAEAVPLAEDVLVIPAAALAVFSASQNGVLTYQTGRAESATTLEWRDRAGRTTGTLGDPAMYRIASLSPDGRLAVSRILDTEVGTFDLWIHELERDLRTRFSFHAEDDVAPVWSPDSETIYFASDRDGGFDVYKKSLAGAGEVELVQATEQNCFPESISPDGTKLTMQMPGKETGGDIWMLDLSSGGEPRPIRQTEFQEGGSTISPDGRWMAYHSDESGSFEVYVTPFPGPGRRWQVSKSTGGYPQWRDDGREIVYTQENGQLVATAVSAEGDTFKVGKSEDLFAIQGPEGDGAYYSLSGDGEQLLIVPALTQQADTLLNLTVNWPEVVETRR
jgi:serine/threonine protein kinase/Tol biopolymer transport system component